MPDVDKLRELVYQFSFYSKPSKGDYSAPCTVGDLNKVIKNVSELFYSFIDELEKDQWKNID